MPLPALIDQSDDGKDDTGAKHYNGSHIDGALQERQHEDSDEDDRDDDAGVNDLADAGQYPVDSAANGHQDYFSSNIVQFCTKPSHLKSQVCGVAFDGPSDPAQLLPLPLKASSLTRYDALSGLCTGCEAALNNEGDDLRMPRFFEPDLSVDHDSPFARDASNKLVRRSYWLDMPDRSLVLAMTQGIGASLTNDEKRAHLADIRREHLIDQVCVQEILPPEK